MYTDGHGMFPKKQRNDSAFLAIAIVGKEDQRLKPLRLKPLRLKQDLNGFPHGEHPLDHRGHSTENQSAMS